MDEDNKNSQKYKEQLRRNRESGKKSRAKKREIAKQMEQKSRFLELENLKLKTEISFLKQEKLELEKKLTKPVLLTPKEPTYYSQYQQNEPQPGPSRPDTSKPEQYQQTDSLDLTMSSNSFVIQHSNVIVSNSQYQQLTNKNLLDNNLNKSELLVESELNKQIAEEQALQTQDSSEMTKYFEQHMQS